MNTYKLPLDGPIDFVFWKDGHPRNLNSNNKKIQKGLNSPFFKNEKKALSSKFANRTMDSCGLDAYQASLNIREHSLFLGENLKKKQISIL